MIRLDSGEVVACFNDTPSGRSPLTLALSHDEDPHLGRAPGPRGRARRGPHPTLMAGADGSVHLVYTWRRERIRWVRFEPAWIAGG